MIYSLGAIRNSKDLRDIKLAQVQAPIKIPNKYITDISFIPVLNQKQLGTCVGHAHAIIQIYNEFKEHGVIKNLSPRYIYAMSKKIDGIPTAQGTFPRVAAKIMQKNGCATELAIPNNTDLSHEQYIVIPENEEIVKDAKYYRVKGYAETGSDDQSLKQAIYQNGLITITVPVGDWVSTPVKLPVKLGDRGLHRILLYGYETIGSETKFYFRNSWSKDWGENGNGYFLFSDYKGKIYDALAFVDLPDEIIIEAKKKYKYFSDKEVVGLKEELVRKLDLMREDCGFPFKITSGLRTKAQNDALRGSVRGSVSDSSHLTGFAADVACKSSIERFKMVLAATKVGINRIGIGKDFVHFDIAIDKPENVMWTYY